MQIDASFSSWSWQRNKCILYNSLVADFKMIFVNLPQDRGHRNGHSKYNVLRWATLSLKFISSWKSSFCYIIHSHIAKYLRIYLDKQGWCSFYFDWKLWLVLQIIDSDKYVVTVHKMMVILNLSISWKGTWASKLFFNLFLNPCCLTWKIQLIYQIMVP